VTVATQTEEDQQQRGSLKSWASGEDPHEALPPRLSSSSDLRPVQKRHSWLGHGRNWRWIWLIIGVLLSLKSFFVRQLLSALLLFTVAFVIAAALIALFIEIDYAADSAVSWVESQVRSIHFSMHHSVALPARFSTGGAHCVMRTFKRLGHN
jgi:uncharacterized membrane protein